ncbi:MAG: cytochrome c [Roseovarius sp.]|nr:cytochrome c [Roseovarius sp.]
MTDKTKPMLAALTALVMGVVFASGGSVTAQEVNPVSPELTPKLRDLLRKEMLSVEEASKQILSALIAGDDARVADLAQQIHDSFILQQSMTPQDKQDLMSVVSKDFVTRDRAFHQLAASLAEAARDGNRTRQHEQFGQMIDACTACHALYATDRFPKLAE